MLNNIIGVVEHSLASDHRSVTVNDHGSPRRPKSGFVVFNQFDLGRHPDVPNLREPNSEHGNLGWELFFDFFPIS